MIDILWWISCAITGALFLLIVAKIRLDTRRQKRNIDKSINCAEYSKMREVVLQDLIMNQLHLKPGNRILCSGCVLHRWFMEGVDGVICKYNEKNKNGSVG